MDIERVNDNTLKLFISYSDIEERGYSREEIWYNRAKGEQLFWDMIDEVNAEDYFDVDGPIWIHVNASEIGLEVVVTHAQTTKHNDSPEADLESVPEEWFTSEDDMTDDLLSQIRQYDETEQPQVDVPENNKLFIYKFNDIDELIPVAKRYANRGLRSSLYKFEQLYYLVIEVDEGEFDGKVIHNVLAEIKEFLERSQVTIHRLSNCLMSVLNLFAILLALNQACLIRQVYKILAYSLIMYLGKNLYLATLSK